jgi:hypothetical protein
MSNCIMCGRLTAPPQGAVTAARSCSLCGIDTYRLPTPEGLIVGAGDRAVFAPGALSISLDRGTGSGQLTRYGLAWFLRLLHLEGYPPTSAEVEATLRTLAESGLKVLHESPLLQDLNFESQVDVLEARRRLDEIPDSAEQWAGTFARNARDTLDAIETGDARSAAFGAMHAATARALWLYADRLEELVWDGYLATGFSKLRDLTASFDANRDNANEAYWQTLLLGNPFLLAQAFATPMVIHQGQAYVGGKEIDNRGGSVTDFVLRNELSRGVVLVEIKTPATRLLGAEYRSGVYGPSRDLSGAVNQLSSNRDDLLKNFFSLAKGRDPGYDPFDPPGVVIAGHSEELDDEFRRRSFELYRRSLKDITVVTFDELFARTEALLRLATEER